MAPKAGTKRAAQPTKSTVPAKVQKKKPEAKNIEETPKHIGPLMKALVNAVQRAELPGDCKEMLKLMIPGSFAVPVEERHELQTAVVIMVGEVIEQMHTEMTRELSETSTALETTEAKKTDLEARVAEAETNLSMATEKVQVNETRLEETTKIAKKQHALFDSTKEAQTKGDAELLSVNEEKKVFVSAVTESFKRLCSIDLEGHEAAHHFQVIQPYVCKLELDESLLIALPSTCQKKLSERGPFDNLVVEQLEKALQSRTVALEAKIAEGGAASADRAAAVKAAEQELTVANSAKDNAADELVSAQAKKKDAGDLLDTAKQAVGEIKLELENMVRGRNEKAIVRNNFESWDMTCYAQLKAKTGLADESATPAVQAQATELSEAAALKNVQAEVVDHTLVCQAGA